MKTESAVCEDWLVRISLEGELDAYTAPQLQDAVTTALSDGIAWLVVDLAGIEYIDSVGLGILIGGAKRAGERGGDLAVAGPRKNVRKVFDVSGTAEMLNVSVDADAAEKRLQEMREARAGLAACAGGGDVQ